MSLALAVTIASASGGAAVADARLPAYVNAYGGIKQRPAQLALWASDSFKQLRWSGWGGAVTTGVGKVTMHGRETGYRYVLVPARIQLSGLTRCEGRQVYLAVRYRISDGPWEHGHTSGCQIWA